MGHQNKLSLTAQIKYVFDDKLSTGESKHAAKADGSYKGHIYSYKTYRVYMEHANRFARFCKQQY